MAWIVCCLMWHAILWGEPVLHHIILYDVVTRGEVTNVILRGFMAVNEFDFANEVSEAQISRRLVVEGNHTMFPFVQLNIDTTVLTLETTELESICWIVWEAIEDVPA